MATPAFLPLTLGPLPAPSLCPPRTCRRCAVDSGGCRGDPPAKPPWESLLAAKCAQWTKRTASCRNSLPDQPSEASPQQPGRASTRQPVRASPQQLRGASSQQPRGASNQQPRKVSRRHFLALLTGAAAVAAGAGAARADGGIDNGSDPFKLRGRLAPRVKKRVRTKPVLEPGAPDPAVKMSVFEKAEEEAVLSLEEEEWGERGKRRKPPKSYEDALFVVRDPPLEVELRAKARLLLMVGCGVLGGALAVNVAERTSVAPRDALPLAYNRKKIQRYCMQRPEKVLGRMGQFAWEILRYAAVAALDKAADTAWIGGRAGKSLRRRRRARQLREGITRLGPGLIKLGQAVSTRPDLVGTTFASELQMLQDSIFQGFGSEEAFSLIEQELGVRNVLDVYLYIDPVPVAGASLGMVYRAWLFEEEEAAWFRRGPRQPPKRGPLEGKPMLSSREEEILRARPELRGKRRVAVKVQRPQVAELCTLDFFVIRSFTSFVNIFLNVRTNLADVVDEYASTVFEELNYAKEANNMERFRMMYARPGPGTSNVAQVYVPRVYPTYSSRRVLTTEWLDVEPLTDSMARVRKGDTSLVDIGILSALDQCLIGGFAHCDQHGGNIMKMRDSDGNGGDRLALVDFGICAAIPPFTRQTLACALMHLMHRDYESLADSFAGMSLMRATDLDAELAELSESLRDSFQQAAAVSVERDEETPSGEEDMYRLRLQRFTFIGVAERLISLGVSFPLVFGDYTISLLRCLSMLEGLAYNANPAFNIVELVYPYVVSLVLEGAREPPFDASLRRLIVDSSGGPGTECIQLVALERLVRLSRPGALHSHSKATSTEPVPVSTESSIIRYALSRRGAFVLELALGQLRKDSIFLGKAWVDKVFFRSQVTDDTDINDAALANVSVIQDVMRRESWTKLGTRKRFRLARIRFWLTVSIAIRVIGHFLRRLYGSVFKRNESSVSTRTKFESEPLPG